MPDYHTDQENPDKFFITDLAIITIPTYEFTFTNIIIPVCLAYNSHTGTHIRHMIYKISGNKTFLLCYFFANCGIIPGWGDHQSIRNDITGEIRHFSTSLLKSAQIQTIDLGECFRQYKVNLI